ncbi:Phosphatidylinositol 5-phosphate 4-kinase type-2 alpha [Chionoecetes opilio]|uniref:Phosphatidylinositol 5-phosphate 4-kinase type-2 alpha n=1 Tax=Chionoecetes opilio TaxID=41210 RepID=A0A8J4Y106_CHIOP|nr:Phosphatidylinositol 5-phosphate 4-kinase type-2 alpha [Chionoecetes opilio]
MAAAASSLPSKLKKKAMRVKHQKVKLFRANEPFLSVFMWGVNHTRFVSWWNADVSFDRGCLQPMLISRRRLTQCIVSHSGIFCDFEGFLQGLLV